MLVYLTIDALGIRAGAGPNMEAQEGTSKIIEELLHLIKGSRGVPISSWLLKSINGRLKQKP